MMKPERVRIPRRLSVLAGAFVVAAAGWLVLGRSQGRPDIDDQAVIRDVLSEASTAQVRAACSMCHVFPSPDMLPKEVWPVAVRGMFSIAERRGVAMAVSLDRAMAWYVFQAPDQLPPAGGRTDAGPGSIAWDVEPWRPADARPDTGRARSVASDDTTSTPVSASPAPTLAPAVTHVQMAPLLGGAGLDIIVSDVSTDRVYALRPYAPGASPVVVGTVPDPGRVAVTDLDGNGEPDLLVGALGRLEPTSDPVGSIVWFRRTGPTAFEPIVLVDSIGRVADVQVADLSGDGRPDLLVAVFGWMENGGLFWLERTGASRTRPAFVRHVLDTRPGFTDVRATDLNRDGHTDVIALIAQEFQQVMVYWGTPDGFRAETVYQAPNPDWGFSGLEVADFTGNGLPDLIITNGDNLDLTTPKPFHGVAFLENLGDGTFAYRHLTAMYGAHRAVPVDLTGAGRPGLVVSAYLPPSTSARAPLPREALLWLERTGPTQLVRRVLKADGVDHMTVAAGDATGDGRPDLALGFMDLGVVDPAQAHAGDPLTAWVTLWRNRAGTITPAPADPADIIDWRRNASPGRER